MSIDSTISRLVDNQLAAGVNATVRKNYYKRQRRFDRVHGLLEPSYRHPADSTGLTRLLNLLHINPRLSVSRYAATYGKVIGGLETMQIEAAFAPRNVKQTKKGGTRKTCHNFGQIFKVGYWGDALMLPYYYLPGQIANLQFIGREAQEDFDRPVKFYKTVSSQESIAGLAYNPDMLASDTSTIFAIEDLIIYLRFQASHYARGAELALPLVHWYDDGAIRTADAWNTFSACRKVFWCVDLTPGVLHQAQLVNGDIALTQILDKSEQGIRGFLQSRIQTRLLQDFARQAKPWPVVLAEWAETHTDRQLEGLLRDTVARGTDLVRLLGRCNLALRVRCTAALEPVVKSTELKLDEKVTLLDMDDGWHLKTANAVRKLSDAKLAIDQALYNPHDDATYYCGRVVYKGQDISFCEKREFVENDTFRWMQTQVIKAGLGVPSYDPRWKGSPVNLALQFKPADIAQGLVSVGWDETERCFDFQNYRLDQFGHVLAQPKRVIWPQTPADVVQPLQLTPLDLEPLLTDSPENRLFWAFTAIQALMALNPMFGYREVGVAVNSPDVGKMFTQMASAAGCLCPPLSQKSLPDALVQESRHNWPICIGMADKAQRVLLRELVESNSDRRCFVKTNWWQARQLVLQGWFGLESTASRGLSEAAMQLVPGIVPTYLANLLGRQSKLESKADEPLQLVLDDMQAWLTDLNCETAVFESARKLILTDRANAVRDLVCSMVMEGFATIVPHTLSREHITRQADGLVIPEELFLGFLDKKSGLNLDPSLVASALGTSHNKRQVKGWLINEGWLAERLAQLRGADL